MCVLETYDSCGGSGDVMNREAVGVCPLTVPGEKRGYILNNLGFCRQWEMSSGLMGVCGG